MKRSLILSLALAVIAPIGLIGCGEETGTTTKTTTTTPAGKVTETSSDKVEKTGDMKDK